MSCQFCGLSESHHHGTMLARRRLFGLAAAVGMLPALAFAKETKAPPKPGNLLSPDAALHELMQGNGRYAQGLTRRHDFASERAALAGGQNPFAAILSCADSRVAPELAFDSVRGDLFVVRVAGNFLNDDNLASFEYAVAVLNTPLLMVLGHASCGAVDATIKAVDGAAELPGHLPSLVRSLTPAVQAVKGQAGDRLENATKANVRMNVEQVKIATPILSRAVAEKKLRVVGGYYSLMTGKVELLA